MNETEEQINVTGATCSNVSVEPASDTLINNDKTIVIDISENDEFLEQFSDEPLEDEEEKAKRKLFGFIKYLKSSRFKNKINSEARKTGIPPRMLAKGFILKAVGIIGDILGIAIGTIHCTINGLIDLIHDGLQKGINIIMRMAQGIARIVTFNQTTSYFA